MWMLDSKKGSKKRRKGNTNLVDWMAAHEQRLWFYPLPCLLNFYLFRNFSLQFLLLLLLLQLLYIQLVYLFINSFNCNDSLHRQHTDTRTLKLEYKNGMKLMWPSVHAPSKETIHMPQLLIATNLVRSTDWLRLDMMSFWIYCIINSMSRTSSPQIELHIHRKIACTRISWVETFTRKWIEKNIEEKKNWIYVGQNTKINNHK